jgi:hypothetical protein
VFGITGAAIGSALALFLFNLIKYGFIWWKFKLQPFSVATLKVLGIAFIVIGMNTLLPALRNVFADMAYRSCLITLIYGSLIVLSSSSSEVNTLFRQGLKILGIKK